MDKKLKCLLKKLSKKLYIKRSNPAGVVLTGLLLRGYVTDCFVWRKVACDDVGSWFSPCKKALGVIAVPAIAKFMMMPFWFTDTNRGTKLTSSKSSEYFGLAKA